MRFNSKEIENLTEEDIVALKAGEVLESKFLDYKKELILDSREDKKNFLIQVTAFANAEGGNLVFGVDEKEGIPETIPGFFVDNIDELLLKIDNILRESVEPKIVGIKTKAIKLENECFVIVIYIPNSFNSPHDIKNNGWRFYIRDSISNRPLDTNELRTAFLNQGNTLSKIENFRKERISKIIYNGLNIDIAQGPKFILHIIPLAAFIQNPIIDLASFDQSEVYYNHTFHGYNKNYNHEGILMHNKNNDYPADRMIQVFRNGCLEIININMDMYGEADKLLYRNKFEEEYIHQLPKYLELLQFFQINFPFIVMLSILDIKGYKIKLFNEYERVRRNKPFMEESMLLPNVEWIEIDKDNVHTLLRPLFDIIWQSAGHPKSPNYTPEGVWEPRREE